MNAIDFVIRTPAGTVERGSVGGEEQGFLLNAGQGNDISLNISQADLRGYDRAANDLLITLADGRVLVLENYFSGDVAGSANSRLFLSANGELNEVSFVEADGGALFAQYGPTETWGKWSPSDQLIFIDDPEVVPQVAGTWDGEEEQVGMLAALPLLGLGGGGAGGLAALLGLPLLFGGDGSDGGGGEGVPAQGDGWVAPTVDDPDGSHAISGNDAAELTITGTANPGSTVEVVIGGKTVTVVAGEDRSWSATFQGGDFPSDGVYPDVGVTVIDPNGTTTTLDGPSFQIDTIPPAIDITGGAVSNGVIVNAVDHGDGVTLSGTGEAGAELTITINGVSQTTVVDGGGNWSFTFDSTVLPGGEYTQGFTLTAKDAFGNTTTVTDSVQIDTVNTITLDNAPLTGDNLISGAEHASGVALSGTSQAGSSIVVTIAGVSHSVTADANGDWSVNFSSSDLAAGTYTATAQIVSTDTAGNVSTMSHSFDVDTEQTVTINTGGVAIDGVVNGSEFGNDVTVTGTGEAGATVVVTSGGVTLGTATVDNSGSWSLDFSPSLIDGGPRNSDLGYTGTLNVTSTDLAGNTSTASGTVKVDTATSVTAGFDDADQIINAAEQAAGVTLQGGAEPGATVEVVVSGTTLSTTADSSGAWSVTVPSAQIPTGVTTLSAAITATDLAGNSESMTATIDVDTQIAVSINANGVTGDGVINNAERNAGVQLTGTTDSATDTVVVTVNGNDYTATVGAGGAWVVTLPTADIPTGNNANMAVTVTSTDAAGNMATSNGTLRVDTETNVAVMTASVEGDGVVNSAEHADGVSLTGTAEAGATVQVTLGTVSKTVTADNTGSWTATYTAAQVPTGERTLNVMAVATDAAGNTDTATGSIEVDTYVRNYQITSTPGGADGIVNQQEAAQGLTLTGTTEPGGSVEISFNGFTRTATVAPNGDWTVTFTAGQIPTADGQNFPLTAVSTDLAGNSSTLTQMVNVDTVAGTLTISPDPVETDNVVNAAEASDGVTLYGTSEPGQMVVVTMDGVSMTVQTAANGIWTANYAANQIRPGTYTANVTAQITDTAGNVLTRTDSFQVDTEVQNFATSTAPVEGDNIINANEASNGFTLSGTTEPGGTVQVTFNGVTNQATVDANGNWSVDFAAGDITPGESNETATVNTTDAVGNTAQTTVSFRVDTLVNQLDVDGPIAGDDTINAAEAAAGITLTGEVEPGSTVMVSINGNSHAATVAANGAWTVDIPSGSIPTGTHPAMPIQIIAQDAAGNVDSITQTVAIDTEAPETLSWTNVTTSNNPVGVEEIETLYTADDIFVGAIDLNGANGVTTVNLYDVDRDPVRNDTDIEFLNVVPDGSHLILATSDAAGNSSASFLVTNDSSTNAVTMTDAAANAMQQYNVDIIDLTLSDADLTITEAQIKALSSTSDTVAIRGGADDSVTINGATAQGTTTQDGVDYNVYSLGDATIFIEDDITNVNGVI